MTIEEELVYLLVKGQQKVSGCFRSEAFAQAFSCFRGSLSTLRKQGMPLLSARPRHSLWSSCPSSTLADLGSYIFSYRLCQIKVCAR